MRAWKWIATTSLICTALAGGTLVAVGEPPPQEEQAEEPEPRPQVWQAFDWQELMADSEQAQSPWLPFLRRPTLSMGVYRLQAGGRDGQSPHAQDEVYYIAEGKAVLQVEDDQVPVEPGSVVYVRAGAEHRFHSIEEELVVLVFFSAAKPPQAPKPRGTQ